MKVKYLDSESANIMATKIALFLLGLGINELQPTLTEIIEVQLVSIDLNNSSYKKVLNKIVENNAGILSPIYDQINLEVSVSVSDTLAGIFGGLTLKYHWTHKGGGSNGYSVHYSLVPNKRMSQTRWALMAESDYQTARDFTENQLRAWEREKQKEKTDA